MGQLLTARFHGKPPAPETNAVVPETVFPSILIKIQDPTVPTEEVRRLIVREIALVVKAMRDPTLTAQGIPYLDQIKALRLLDKQLLETPRESIHNRPNPLSQFDLYEDPVVLTTQFIKAAQNVLGDSSSAILPKIKTELMHILREENPRLCPRIEDLHFNPHRPNYVSLT